MMQPLRVISIAGLGLLALASSGCGLIYKQRIEQGNVIEQSQVDLLKPGMSKRQVELVLGSPATTSPFHQSRWDYVTSIKHPQAGTLEITNLTVFFEGDQLVRIEGDLKPGGGGTTPATPEAELDAEVKKAEADG